MSGQVGLSYLDEREIPDHESAAILSRAVWQEYDSPASYSNRGVFLAHAASQPYVTPAGAITFDGRLDNREDLLIRLRGDLRGDTTDAALALCAYVRWGVEGFVHLIGDWSLAIWDAAQKNVVLASDFAGVRPLYYCVQRNRLLWSTRLNELVDWTEANEIDDEYVAGLLSFGASPNRTPYRGIYSVPSGHAVRIAKDGGTAIHPFWTLPVGDTIRYRRESDYDDQLLALFREAVRCRLRTTGPVLAELSGGLDSSSVVCMASDLIRSGNAAAPRLMTLSYEHAGSVDKPFCTAVEKFCGVESIHAPTAPHPFLTETHAGKAQPAFWEHLHTNTAEIARQGGARTYLTGQLGDLVMANSWDDSDQVAGLLSKGRIGAASRDALSWSLVLRIPVAWVLWRAILSSLPPAWAPAAAHRMNDGSAAPPSTEDSLSVGFRKRVAAPEKSYSQDWMEAPPERRKHFRSLTEILQSRKLQPPEPLQHLYYTHPFAHRPLVTFMLSIPAGVCCRAGEPRRLMRRAFHDLWPAELRKRRSKDSFSGVFLESLRPLANELLKRPRQMQVVERGYVEVESIKKRLEQLSHLLECNESQLRQIILLEFWLRGRDKRRRAQPMPLSA